MPASRPSRAREALTIAKALVVGGERREAAIARIVRPTNLFQPYTTTSPDRYPDEFEQVRTTLVVAEPRILSFGCSSGDELLTLRLYFPTSRIDGIDANPLAIRTARKRIAAAGLTDRITATKGTDASAVPPASYDAVLALAVFRHGGLSDSPPRCDHLIRFADFERTVSDLGAAVKPGGVFVIRHANFRFTDCAVAAGFELVQGGYASGGAGGLPSPVYGRDDELLDLDQRDDGIYRRT
ncbi:methyltransferase [Marmoricola sp. OAE513]|uniref:class I SAM-dependent methyltransferase n=1 Tax=Marmoricola sp. OAE513 TaxID=2817894 RepID=UPI001AE77E09